MDKRLHVALIVAVVLSGGGGAYLYYGKGGAPSRPAALQVSLRSDVLEQCLEAAQMTFDVHWAAACATQSGEDNGAECDLPTDKAAVVNAWLNEADKSCMAEARGAR